MAELDQLYDKTAALEDDVTHSSCRTLTELRNEANNQRPDVHLMLTAIKTISKKFEAWSQAVEDLTISYSQNPAVAVPVNVAKLDQLIGSAQDNNSAEVKHKGDVKLVITNSHKQANKENEESHHTGEPNGCTAGVIQTSRNDNIANVITRSQLSIVTSWFDCDNQIETALRTAFDKLLTSFRQSQGSATTDRNDDSNDWWISAISEELLESKKSRDAGECWTDIHHKLVEVERQIRKRDSTSNRHLLEVFESLNPAVDSYNSFHEGRCQFQSKLQHSLNRPAALRATNELSPHQKPQRKYYAIKLTTVDTFVKEETVCISPTKHSEPMTSLPVTSANGDVTNASDDSKNTNGHINGDHPNMTCDNDDENMSSPADKLTSSDDDVNESSRKDKDASCDRRDSAVNGNGFTAEDDDVNYSEPNEQPTATDDDINESSRKDKDASCDRRDSAVNGNGFTAEDDDVNYSEPNEQPTATDDDINESSRKDKDASCDRRDSAVNGNGFTAEDDDVNYSEPSEQPTAMIEHQEQTPPVDQTDGQNGGVTTANDDETYNGSMKNGSRRETVEADQLTSVSHEESVKFIVKSVIDPRDGKELTIDEAVRDGIVDHRTGQYINPATGVCCPIGEAMNDGRIRIERVVTTSRTAEERRSVGLITIRVQTDTKEYDIKGAVDLATGQSLTADEARKRNIVDEASGTFLNTKTGEKMPLSDAVDAGHVIADFDADAASSQAPCETKTYAVCAVVDQAERKPVPFPEAVRRGLIDRHTGCYINNVTGERVFAGDAVKRGLFKCRAVDDSSTFDEIDESNRVVADRIQHVRSNVLRNMKILSALKKSAIAK